MLTGDVVTAVLMSTLRMATPLTFGALGGIYAEKSGIVNIAIEGMMLIGAFSAMVVSYYTHNPWLGLLGACVGSATAALLLAILSIRYNADQVVSGVAINLLAVGLTGYLLKLIFKYAGQSPSVTQLPDWSIPIVEKVPFLGDVIGRHSPMVYLAGLAVVSTHILIYKTVFGLRMRAVGEHPKAADTVGVDVRRTRYICCIISGAMAGLGGATLSIGLMNVFVENMTQGRGFIALAAMVFGKWTPLGSLFACLLFGLADAVQMNAQTYGLTFVPKEVLMMVPYLLTMATLAGVIGRSVAPAASGKPYSSVS